MKIQDIKTLPEGTQLRTGAGDVVTLTGTVRAMAIVRDQDGQTREHRAASLHLVSDPYPIVKGRRPGLTGHTVTVERTDRTTARLRLETETHWQDLIGRLAVVQREDGRLRRVHAIGGAEFTFDDEAELAAERVARERGARYVPAGQDTAEPASDARPATRMAPDPAREINTLLAELGERLAPHGHGSALRAYALAQNSMAAKGGPAAAMAALAEELRAAAAAADRIAALTRR